jgi:hypothetical protein
VGKSRSGWVAALVATSLALLFWAPSVDSARTDRTAVTISDIAATFSDPDRATTYSVKPTADAGAQVTYSWTLVVIAPAGQVDPNKGVDIGCNNHGVLTGTDKTFVWHHGNTGDPLHDDGCNHDLQGKWGHQGLIAVVVRDGLGNQCTATYKGSYPTTRTTPSGRSRPASPPAAPRRRRPHRRLHPHRHLCRRASACY